MALMYPVSLQPAQHFLPAVCLCLWEISFPNPWAFGVSLWNDCFSAPFHLLLFCVENSGSLALAFNTVLHSVGCVTSCWEAVGTDCGERQMTVDGLLHLELAGEQRLHSEPLALPAECSVLEAEQPQMAIAGVACQRNFWPFPFPNCIREEYLSLAWFPPEIFLRKGAGTRRLSYS